MLNIISAETYFTGSCRLLLNFLSANCILGEIISGGDTIIVTNGVLSKFFHLRISGTILIPQARPFVVTSQHMVHGEEGVGAPVLGRGAGN